MTSADCLFVVCHQEAEQLGGEEVVVAGECHHPSAAGGLGGVSGVHHAEHHPPVRGSVLHAAPHAHPRLGRVLVLSPPAGQVTHITHSMLFIIHVHVYTPQSNFEKHINLARIFRVSCISDRISQVSGILSNIAS